MESEFVNLRLLTCWLIRTDSFVLIKLNINLGVISASVDTHLLDVVMCDINSIIVTVAKLVNYFDIYNRVVKEKALLQAFSMEMVGTQPTNNLPIFFYPNK